MNSLNTSDMANVGKFWDRYLAIMLERGVKESARRWYVLRAEQFIKAAGGKRLLDHTAADVSRYLGKVGRKGGVEGWQFRQTVDTIQILSEGAQEFRGQYKQPLSHSGGRTGAVKKSSGWNVYRRLQVQPKRVLRGNDA